MIDKKYKLNTSVRRQLADTVTPVSIYLRLRDKFANSLLLESSDYHGNENSFSYICCDPIASIKLEGLTLSTALPTESSSVVLEAGTSLTPYLRSFANAFDSDSSEYKFINNGIFGYMSYDTVAHFEDIELDGSKEGDFTAPTMSYSVYRYIIALDHFKNELYIFEHDPGTGQVSRLDEIAELINSKNVPDFGFRLSSDVASNYTDEEFLDIVNKGIRHCLVGDVFQIVLSRRFSVGFKGDEFQVYRALRSINPSPYLFYFDYGSFKIFGSSPEAQIVIKGGEATIYPIAGTFRRTGNDAEDAELARKLYDDPKENSEHVMLVDLARNDLSKSSSEVKVDTFKEVQYYSHVIHLVSKVQGKLTEDADPLDMVASTFPAGTLSGAPKHRAMQLIDQYENRQRGYYGGAIGFMDFNGDFNHAIMIRSFLSQNNKLHFQAGAGVVAKSNPESEVQEVFNKLGALQSALSKAEEL
ncbi:MAG: anthranilate synthase component I family protein [Bacteroidota bacterium]